MKKGEIIALYGPRAVGKTTIGKQLAKELTYEFIDFDHYCSEELTKEGYQGAQGFRESRLKKDGPEGVWKTYAKWQRKTFKKLIQNNKENIVLDIGGGTLSEDFFKKKINEPLLRKEKAKKFLLLPSKKEKESIELLFKRERKRPFFKEWKEKDLKKKVKEDYHKRTEIFMKFKDPTIFTLNKTPKQISKEITKILKTQQTS